MRTYSIAEACKLLARPNRRGTVKTLTPRYVRDLLRLHGFDTVPHSSPTDRRVRVGVTAETVNELRRVRGIA